MNEIDKMISGDVYFASNPEVSAKYKEAKYLTRQYNFTTDEEENIRIEIINKLFSKIGKRFHIEPPFRCDYGFNIKVGENFYANYECIILDVCKVNIGDNVFFGPRVSIYTATHPISAKIRNTGLEYGKSITIGSDVWVGGDTVINPGVTIGNNVVIGSGSVVTKDIPSNVIVAGNPCKVIREITIEDDNYWTNIYNKYINNIK